MRSGAESDRQEWQHGLSRRPQVALWEQTASVCLARVERVIDVLRSLLFSQMKELWPDGKTPEFSVFDRMDELMERPFPEWRGCLSENGWDLEPTGAAPNDRAPE